MKKIDPVILKETAFVALVSLAMSVFMQSIFLIVDYWVPNAWDWLIIIGNLIGYIASVGNFFLMGLTVQKALGKEPKDAANFMKVSQMARILMLFLVALGAYLIDQFAFDTFNVGFIIAVIVPYTFPRIAVMLRPLASKIKNRGGKNE